MRILLATLNSKYVHTNLALRYLKVCLEEYTQNCETFLKEYTINDNTLSILASIYKTEADIYAFSCYIWNIEQTLEICANLKKIKPESIIVLGGPEVSYESIKIMKENSFIDYIISGEGEKSLPKLICALSDNALDINSIEGLTFRNSAGDIRVNNPHLIEDLSEIPSPFNDDLSCYKDKVAYYESSRGCPYNCSYCLSSTIKGVRYFPIDRVKSDLKKLIDAGAKQVKFVDRTFNCLKEKALEIWKYITENNKDTIFHFEIAAHLIDDEVLDFLSKVPEGMFEFEIGVQTTNKEALCEVGRKTDFDKIKETVTTLRTKNNIHIHLDLIAGLPYENYKSFEKSFNDVYFLNSHMLQLGFLKLLKGSRIRDEYEKHGYKFTAKPPYEVLENRYISYQEIIKLKRIEEMLEIYKNSGRYENAFNYLNRIYTSPFTLFQDLSDYWYKRNMQTRRISQEENYDILFEFYENIIQEDIDEFKEILKIDFVMNNFGLRRCLWQEKYLFKDMKNAVRNILNNQEFVIEYCPELIESGISERFKKVNFEIVKIKGDYNLLMLEKSFDSRGNTKLRHEFIDKKYYHKEEIIISK